MKKILIYFFAFILMCFIIPLFLTKTNMETDDRIKDKEIINNEEKNIQTSEEIEQKQENNKIIKLLHKNTGDVEEVDLESYICNVVSAEMPANFEMEALKAQAIVARTYTLYKMKNKKHSNADICDDWACCQAWISKEDRLLKWNENERENNWKKIFQSVYDTKGKIITYKKEPINAFFHSNSGGKTELPVNVWGGTGYPYLQVVETSGEEGYTQYESLVELKFEELIEKLKSKYTDIEINFSDSEEIKIMELTDSGRVRTVKFGNHELSGVETRTLLGLKSTNFEIIKEDNKIKFQVKGYGHRCWNESNWS